MNLDISFYSRSSKIVAIELLGKLLIHKTSDGIASGIIVETESYGGRRDPGSHAFRKMTPRNKIMFGPPGVAYVYFCYGNHYLFNIVTEKEGTPGAVLIRALEPVDGIKLMMKRRRTNLINNLTNGPGKLTCALDITKKENGVLILSGNLKVMDIGYRVHTIVKAKRIGIKQGSEKFLRFYIKGNPYVSVVAKSRPEARDIAQQAAIRGNKRY